MYKTVRKGDTSLQYTILPQTDQFSSGGFPQASGKPRSGIIKYTLYIVMALIILSCVAPPFLMNNKYDPKLFVSRMRAMLSRVELERNVSRSQMKNVSESKNRGRITTTTVSTTEVTRRKDLEDGTTSFNVILRGEEEEEEAMVDDVTADTPEISTQVISSMETSTRDRQAATTSSALPSTMPSIFSALSTTSKASSSGTTEDTKTLQSTPKKPKMPRVTLKLRENETIPQMYVKAGIASYKKGNITTSVLAPRLSLEGLIFKTPEGTIKPWPQKWFFGEPSDSDVKTWKVFAINHMPMITVCAIFGGMCATACGLIALMIHVQRKAFKRAEQNIEEPEIEEHESILLGAESQEIEEKE